MDIITPILNIISSIFGNLSEDKKAALTLALQQDQNLTDLMKSQAAIDANEASNANVFVAGWRPFIGWTCGCAFAWCYLLQPMITYICLISGHPVPPMPQLDQVTMSNVLMGILGLGTMRTWEKYKGVTK